MADNDVQADDFKDTALAAMLDRLRTLLDRIHASGAGLDAQTRRELREVAAQALQLGAGGSSPAGESREEPAT